MNAQLKVVQDYMNKLLVQSQNKKTNNKSTSAIVQLLQKNINATAMAVKDPAKTVRESSGPENTQLRIGRRIAEHVKVRLAEDEEERLEMQHQVENDAFFAKIIGLIALILSVGMLLFSYKIDHGEIMGPLRANFDDATKLAVNTAYTAVDPDTYTPLFDSVYNTAGQFTKQISDNLEFANQKLKVAQEQDREHLQRMQDEALKSMK